MAPYRGFINGSHPLRSRNITSEITRNWFPEIATGTPKASPYLVPRPGLEVFVVLGAGPVRGLFYQDLRCFAVGGAYFYEVFPNHTMLYRGSVAVDGRPATICSNGTAGNQVFVTSGGYGYIFDLGTNTFTQIADPDFPYPCRMGGFIDGYFLALKANSRQFNFSALEDGLAWDGLDVNEVSQSSDNLQALIVINRNVWLPGSKNTAVWADVGDADNPLQPIPGVQIQQGSTAGFSFSPIDNSVNWLGTNEQGGAMVFRAEGFSPRRISTHGVEQKLSSYSRLDDAIGWTFQQDGHNFYLLYIPSADVVWVYDVASEQWSEWSIWDDVLMRDEPWLPRCHAFAFGHHLVGDRTSGAIYRMGTDLYADGQVIVN